ncbi:MAG: type IV pilus modification protein PilV [Pseudomonadales bacterium]|nr:type IV pilus modification protein PilV [Pseudomonadales bacterium]
MSVIHQKIFKHSVAHKQSGFSLIEVMITAVIIGGSLLGIAQLQATSVRNSQDAYYRAAANTLAYEIIDRMRANRTVASTTTNYDIDLGDAVIASNCETANCTPAQISKYDLEAWKYLLATNLPVGDGAVNVVLGATGAEITVTVEWQDNDSSGNRGDYSLNVSTLL